MALEEPGLNAAAPARRRWRDWRIWVGVAIPAAAIAWTVRGLELEAVLDALASVSLLGLAAMLPAHVLAIWLRALRWRHLVAPLSLEPVSVGALFRATAVGFMAINLLPFRLGELARPWFLAQETDLRASAALGTLVVERAIDAAMLALLGGVLLVLYSQDYPTWVRSGALLAAAISLVPFALVLALRVNDRLLLRWVRWLTRLLPDAVGERVVDLVEQVCAGILALRGARAVLRVVAYSVLLWAFVIPVNFAIGFAAFGIELPPLDALKAAYTAHVFVAVAVAAPSAPGFFGVYHFACREALALFGIAPALAVAYGTVSHLTYWVPVTLAGLISFASADLRFGDLTAAALGKAPSGPHR